MKGSMHLPQQGLTDTDWFTFRHETSCIVAQLSLICFVFLIHLKQKAREIHLLALACLSKFKETESSKWVFMSYDTEDLYKNLLDTLQFWVKSDKSNGCFT
jgi:hypothetical protein